MQACHKAVLRKSQNKNGAADCLHIAIKAPTDTEDA